MPFGGLDIFRDFIAKMILAESSPISGFTFKSFLFLNAERQTRFAGVHVIKHF
jgi:hypothetical protein